MKKLWAGRFREKTAKSVESFTESISFDRRLWKYDIEGSIAHTMMLAKQGIITKKDSEAIIKGLREIASAIESGKFRFRDDLEDLHMNIEVALTEMIGDSGKRLHTARSRNDQIALDIRLYMRAEIKEILSMIRSLQIALLDSAEVNIDVIMPGYTHMQRAQPVLLSHHLLAYIHMINRDSERLRDCLKRVNILPLGSCAMAGTSLPIDRRYVAEILGFDGISENTIDAVSDRDFLIEFLSNMSILMMHLSRFAEELVLWSTEEFGFVTISDAFTTGSSIMPQKKNPDVAELIRGKTGRVYGDLISLLTTMKGLPLSYNRDLQEDKEPLFDAIDTVKATLGVLREMIPAISFDQERMYESASKGYTTATDIAEYLVKKGIPFRQAHEITGKIVLYCLKIGKDLNELDIKEFKDFSDLIDNDIYSVLTPEGSIRNKISYGSTSGKEVIRQIRRLKALLKNK